MESCFSIRGWNRTDGKQFNHFISFGRKIITSHPPCGSAKAKKQTCSTHVILHLRQPSTSVYSQIRLHIRMSSTAISDRNACLCWCWFPSISIDFEFYFSVRVISTSRSVRFWFFIAITSNVGCRQTREPANPLKESKNVFEYECIVRVPLTKELWIYFHHLHLNGNRKEGKVNCILTVWGSAVPAKFIPP